MYNLENYISQKSCYAAYIYMYMPNTQFSKQ